MSLSSLESAGDPAKAAEAAEYHKADRRYLGTPMTTIDALVTEWRNELTLDERLTLASDLWDSDVHEARVAAAKLLVQARIRPDDRAWDLVQDWVQQLDSWAIADLVCKAAEKRITADPTRLDVVETWTSSENMWTRRAALVSTLYFAKLNNLKPAEVEARERVLGWLENALPDRDWFIQKAIVQWLRDLSKHDAERVRLFLAEHAEVMRGFTRKEAAQYL